MNLIIKYLNKLKQNHSIIKFLGLYEIIFFIINDLALVFIMGISYANCRRPKNRFHKKIGRAKNLKVENNF